MDLQTQNRFSQPKHLPYVSKSRINDRRYRGKHSWIRGGFYAGSLLRCLCLPHKAILWNELISERFSWTSKELSASKHIQAFFFAWWPVHVPLSLVPETFGRPSRLCVGLPSSLLLGKTSCEEHHGDGMMHRYPEVPSTLLISYIDRLINQAGSNIFCKFKSWEADSSKHFPHILCQIMSGLKRLWLCMWRNRNRSSDSGFFLDLANSDPWQHWCWRQIINVPEIPVTPIYRLQI